MATLKKGKKVVQQEELRRLMREKQRQNSDRKRVDSPFARYSSAGTLSCTLCAAQLKSELLWTTHVLGKTHREKLAELKVRKQKRRAPEEQEEQQGEEEEEEEEEEQRRRGGKKARCEEEEKEEKQEEERPRAASAGLSLLAGCYEEEEEEEEGAQPAPTPTSAPTPTPNPTSAPPPEGLLPADFFDSSIPPTPTISHSGSILKAEAGEKSSDRKENSAEALPEGFFDDPVRDAKVRNVDAPKDQMDKEWEEFQKEIRQVNTKSEAIVAEDDEEGRLGRQIDEIDEQIECYKRVELLRDRREVVRSSSEPRSLEEAGGGGAGGGGGPGLEEEDEDDEEELLGLLARDWRAKGALA